ncbi:MAG: histidine phosphatase family protein [Pelagibacterales bacterium MED-G40]|nr:MAG: histidine phosphatase family protein [Pelagibacterales bacterium MED-G40]|tara:strand:+ start:1627 stop:2178 length:552 start_codon:yes stop_codon:yes gene_type:complete
MAKKILIFIIFSLFISSSSFSETEIIKELQKGGKIVLIRHALAPGGGDPPDFKLDECATQRNLDSEGINQSKRIGLFFSKNQIPIDKVLSSEWCRCKDTARFAFKNFDTFNALNSFFDERFKKNKTRQIQDLKDFLKKWDSKKNLVLITHYVVILEISNKTVSSGEIVILDKNLNFIGSINYI